MSLAQVLCPDFEFRTGCNHPKVPGSRVMLGNNLGPVYVVIHVHGDRAWVRPLANGSEGLADVAFLRVI